MQLTLATWNINSVRLRLPLVERLTAGWAPDVLCLQETKCPDGQFPTAAIKRLGYRHLAFNGQRGYHGVAILSRLPLHDVDKRGFCEMGDARHISAGIARPDGSLLRVHNFYVPAGGDEPDPQVNPKFDHKLRFLREMTGWFADDDAHGDDMILVGDLNVAPLEHDVWSHRRLLRVVSHTPIEVEHLDRLQRSHRWLDLMRRDVPADQKLYTWWSYRARDWQAADKGRRLDHIWLSPSLDRHARSVEVVREARGWNRPSDHVPVIARFRF